MSVTKRPNRFYGRMNIPRHLRAHKHKVFVRVEMIRRLDEFGPYVFGRPAAAPDAERLLEHDARHGIGGELLVGPFGEGSFDMRHDDVAGGGHVDRPSGVNDEIIDHRTGRRTGGFASLSRGPSQLSRGRPARAALCESGGVH